MTNTPSATDFMNAQLMDRAVLLLRNSFRDPAESVNRVNVANALANDARGGGVGALGSAGGPADAAIYRSVSEAWQVLEQARLVCRDLQQPQGDWWLLTDAGRGVRDSGDPVGELDLRLRGH